MVVFESVRVVHEYRLVASYGPDVYMPRPNEKAIECANPNEGVLVRLCAPSHHSKVGLAPVPP